MDRTLVTGAILLLFLEVGLLLAGLDDVPAWRKTSAFTSGQVRPIGQMKHTESHVRRRPRASLVWEESRPQDQLFEFDSILTLSGSTAQIQFNTQTTLNIDENTLVVLEESPDRDDGSLRVRFSRGTVRSANPSHALRFDSDEWSLTAEKGSVVNLVSLNDGRIDLEIKAGQATLNSGEKEYEISGGERLIIRDTKIEERKRLDEALSWNAGLPSRIYSRVFPVETDIKWHGNAKQVQLIKPDKSIETITLNENTSHSLKLSLNPGTYLVSLLNGDHISEAHPIQVRAAPLFRYFSPLPRNRVRSGVESIFSWEPSLFATHYRLELSTDPSFSSGIQSWIVNTPRVTTKIEAEGAYYWRVIGLDDEQTPIPEPRVYPLYVIPDPLQSPELKAPTIRRPATPEKEKPRSKREKTSLLWNLLFPAAWAKTDDASDFEAVFSWSTVDGADHYIIEISESPGFEEPIVIQRVTEPQFIWRNFKKGIYFWRVAAGQSGNFDRLGLFSPIAVANLENLDQYAGPGVTLSRKSQEPIPVVAKTPPPPKKIEEPEPEPPAIPEPEPEPPKEPGKWQKALAWTPSYRIMSMDGTSNIQGSFNGPTLLAFEGEIQFSDSWRFWSLKLSFDETYWKPKSEKETPFQPSIKEQRMGAELITGRSSSALSFGLGVESIPVFKRKAPEEGDLQNLTVFGLTARYLKKMNDRHSFDFSFAARFGQIFGGRAHTGWNYKFLQTERAGYSARPYISYGHYENDEFRVIDQQFGLSLSMEW